MNEARTTSILQRVPVILAVTAASYGLPLQSRSQSPGRAGMPGGMGRAVLKPLARAPRETAPLRH